MKKYNFLDISSSSSKLSFLALIPLSLTSCGDSPKVDPYKRLDYSVETYYTYGQKYSGKKRYSSAVGEQKILVVPVIIKGYESNATEANKNKIYYSSNYN